MYSDTSANGPLRDKNKHSSPQAALARRSDRRCAVRFPPAAEFHSPPPPDNGFDLPQTLPQSHRHHRTTNVPNRIGTSQQWHPAETTVSRRLHLQLGCFRDHGANTLSNAVRSCPPPCRMTRRLLTPVFEFTRHQSRAIFVESGCRRIRRSSCRRRLKNTGMSVEP